MNRGSLWCGLLAASLLSACDDGALRAFEPRLALGGTSGTGSDGQSGTASAEAGSNGQVPTSPLLIDDFEDGDPIAREPLGWWYPVNDKTSAQGFGIEPLNGGSTSVYALRTHGSGFQAWGAAVGVDLIAKSRSLDAVGYERLCFSARVEAGSSTLTQVHLLKGEQHYIQEASLSESWTRYCRTLVDFKGPAEAALVPNGLIALQFFFVPNSPFAFWLDDVELTPF
jgi:hypothetical protein